MTTQDESAQWLDDCAECMEDEGLDRENNARHFRAGAKAIRTLLQQAAEPLPSAGEVSPTAWIVGEVLLHTEIKAKQVAAQTGLQAIPLYKNYQSETLKKAAQEYMNAVSALGEHSGYNHMTFFECPIIKSPDEIGKEAQKRWQALNDAGLKLKDVIHAAQSAQVEEVTEEEIRKGVQDAIDDVFEQKDLPIDERWHFPNGVLSAAVNFIKKHPHGLRIVRDKKEN